MIDPAWWQFYDPDELPPVDEIVQAWDLTNHGGPTADYVVGQAWAACRANRYLLRQTRARMSLLKSIEAIDEMTAWVNSTFPGHRGHSVLIEEAANGYAAIEMLSGCIGGLIRVHPEGSKRQRVAAVTPQIEAGNVFLPKKAAASGLEEGQRQLDWVADFVHEATMFPDGVNDDQVDAMAHALRGFSRPGPRIRVLGPLW